ncbi:MAG TPA: flagellar protein FlgN [Clostridiales bacterium]|nr:flagellar protein FlgN [Clostridiales bacterium]
MDEKGILEELLQKSFEKEEALKRLLQLTTAQGHFIKEKDINGLNQAIEEKKKIMEEIDSIDVAFLSSYQALKKKLNVQSLEEIDLKQFPSLKDLKISIQRIMYLLKQIDMLDQKNRKQLEEDFETLKKEMKEVLQQKKSQKVASIYRQKYVGGEGAFIDNKRKK